MSTTKLELQTQLVNFNHKLSVELAELKEAASRSSKEASEDMQRLMQETRQHTEAVRRGLQHELREATAALEERLQRSLTELEASLRAAELKMSSMEEETTARIVSLRNTTLAMDAVRSCTWGALLKQQGQTLGSAIAEMHEAFTERHEEVLTHATHGHREVKELHENHIAEHAQKAQQMEQDLRDAVTRLEGLCELQRQETEATVLAQGIQTREGLEHLRALTERQLIDLDSRTVDLENVVAEVENLPTRRVEWQIRDVTSKLFLPSDSISGFGRPRHDSWLSPRFEAAGAHNLRMELRHLRPNHSFTDGADEPSDGDTALCLWADAGLFLVCKLYIGAVSVQLQHTFDGQTPYSTRALCFLREQISRADDSLTVGLDILEAVRTVEQRRRPAALEAADAAGRFQPESSIVSHRYLNHRTLDLVQNQVELMRSRMVRRIEWRLERASLLRRCFPEGESVCSTTFEAAGVEGLQLVFYPSGYQGVREGFCSFFLHCPAGSMLKCWLSAGKQRREARLTFERPGFFGRTNFCRFESCIDTADDTVLLVLEIDEAAQSVTENLSHQPAAAAAILHTPNSGAQQDSAGQLALPEKIDSSVRLRRTPGRQALEDVRQLPSIWTPRPMGDIAESLDGFHPFSDMKAVKRPSTGRKQYSHTVPWKAEPVPSPKPVNTELAQRYVMYAA